VSGGGGADAAGSVISAESGPCEVLVGGGACWAIDVAAAGASAGPVPSSEGTAKTEAKAVLAVGENFPRAGRRSTVATEADTRATNLPEGAERSSILIRGPCVRTSRKSEEVKGSPPKTPLLGPGTRPGTSPPKPTPGVGEERVMSPQARIRNISSSSAGVRLQAPLRSCSVAGSGKRDRKSAFPLALPLRYLSMKSNAVRNSSHRWTRGLWSPTLPMLSSALWSEKMRNFVPHR